MTHRKGRGWRGGYLGSATETYLKLDLNKWLKVLRHLELLPRPLGQDWSGIWLQQFSGTITIWPKSRISDFYYILSDPTTGRLANMLKVGQQSTFPKILFIENRMKIERLIEEGLLLGRQSDDTEKAIRLDKIPYLHGQTGVDDVESSSTDEQPLIGNLIRRPSIIEELKRQSGVFFDNVEGDAEDSDGSDQESSVAHNARHSK